MDGIIIPSASLLLTLIWQCDIHVVSSTSAQLPALTLMQLLYEMHETLLNWILLEQEVKILFILTVVVEWKDVKFISCLSKKKFPVKSTLTTICTPAKHCNTISSEAILSRQAQ